MKADGFNYRNQQLLSNFNKRLKASLKGQYKYINTNSYLRKTGLPTYTASNGIKSADGLHYTACSCMIMEATSLNPYVLIQLS